MTTPTLAATERTLRELRFAFDLARTSRTATAAEREALLAEIRETVALRNALEAAPVAPHMPDTPLRPASRTAAIVLADALGK